MPPLSRRHLLALAGAAATLPVNFARAADDYPNRPIRIIVPFAAGGGTDLITRALADVIANEWRSTIVIENRAGAGTTIGSMSALSAPDDGYTVLAISNGFLVTPAMMTPPPYIWNRDFTGVSLFAWSPHILVLHPAVPAKNFAEFVALAKAPGGHISYASFGNGSSNHLGFEILKQKIGIEATHIPYKGSAPAVNDLLGGHVTAMLGDLQNVSEQIKAGTLRAIAVANERRLASMPDLPTLMELGVTDFTSKSLFGAVMRKSTPPAIVDKWGAAFAAALQKPELQQRLGSLGLELVGLKPAQMNDFLASEAVKMEAAVKQSGARME